MSERAYTVKELDDLREVVEHKWLYWSYKNSDSDGSRSYTDIQLTTCVEELVRTHMIAGHTAEQLRESER